MFKSVKRFFGKKNVPAPNPSVSTTVRPASSSTSRTISVPRYTRRPEGIDVVSTPIIDTSDYVPSGGYSTPEYCPYSDRVEPDTFSGGGGGGSGFDGGGAGGSWDASSSNGSSDASFTSDSSFSSDSSSGSSDW